MKKGILYAGLVLVLAVALVGCASPTNTSDAMQRTITVTGTGEASANPDVAYLYLGVESVDPDVSVAFADNTTRMNAVYQVLQDAGIAEDDLQTSTYSVSREGNSTYRATTVDDEASTEANFYVTNIVQVTVRDVASVGDLITKAFEAGANSVQSVSFAVEDTTALETQARTNALADAQARAEQIASEMGVTLGNVQSVSDSSYVPYETSASYALGGGGASVSSGQYDVSVQAYVVYEIAD